MAISQFLRLTSFLVALSTLSIVAHDTNSDHEHCAEGDPDCEVTVKGIKPPQPPSPTDRRFRSPANQNNETGGTTPTNSTSNNCEGSGCINYEDSYGPMKQKYLRYDPKKHSHRQDCWQREGIIIRHGNGDGKCVRKSEYRMYVCQDFADVKDALSYAGMVTGVLSIIPITAPVGIALTGILAAVYVGIDFGMPEHCQPFDE